MCAFSHYFSDVLNITLKLKNYKTGFLLHLSNSTVPFNWQRLVLDIQDIANFIFPVNFNLSQCFDKFR